MGGDEAFEVARGMTSALVVVTRAWDDCADVTAVSVSTFSLSSSRGTIWLLTGRVRCRETSVGDFQTKAFGGVM